jgi:hypothetical protein
VLFVVAGVSSSVSSAVAAFGGEAAAAPSAPSLFVARTGSDTNRCTAAAPCATMTRAYAVARPGQVVQVAGGTYRRDETFPARPGPRSTRAVVFQPAPSAKVVLTREVFVSARNIEFRDMAFTDGWTVQAGANNITFRNIAAKGIFVLSASNVRVLGGSVGPGLDYHPIVGATTPTPPRNVLFDGVLFHDWRRSKPEVHTECLQIGAGDGVVIRNSRFRNCDVMDIHVTHYGPAPETQNVTLENNFFSEATDGGFFSIQTGVYRNLLVRHNSFAQALLMFPTNGPNVGVRVIGNVGPAPTCVPGVTYRHNVWDGRTCGSTDVDAPSGFVNAAKGDLHLRPGSAAIDRGDPANHPRRDIDGDARPAGKRPDAGADESAARRKE